ncbi:MAG: Tfp pilus assembly protein FimT/FimU [Acidobacteriaceae bacterium]
MRRTELEEQRGFSLVELVIVMAIMLAIAAYAIPSTLSAISDYRLKNTMTQVAGLFQQQRIQAVRLNSVVTSPQAQTINGRTVRWFDTPSTSTATHTDNQYDAGEPMIEFPNKIQIATSGAPTLSASVAGFSAQSTTTAIKFNARGLPCIVTTTCVNLDTTTNPSTPKQIGFLIYFKNNKSFGQTGWGAVTISPSGRINTWVYNGSSYSKM